MISGTITDKSGRLLSGQLPEAFWNSVRHARPITIGFNCALGAEDLRAHIADIGRVADTLVCAYPNAGLPNEFGQYDESPEYMARLIGEFAASRPGQHRRRLLRHHAGPYRGDCGRRRAAQAARDSRDRTAAAAVGPRAVRTHAGDSLCQCRRAHQRHGIGADSASWSPPATIPPHCRWRATRSRTAPRSSTSTWTRACWIPKPRW